MQNLYQKCTNNYRKAIRGIFNDAGSKLFNFNVAYFILFFKLAFDLLG